MEAATIHGMQAEYLLVDKKKFTINFNCLRKNGFEAKEIKDQTWKIAKALFAKDYKAGNITDSMNLKNVHENTREEYKAVEWERFNSNAKRLIKRIKKDKARADVDNAGCQHDMSLYTFAQFIPKEWHGSTAEALLKQDVKGGLHKHFKPKELWKQRPEYQQFNLNIFRNHIYQESCSQVEAAYWLVKKQKKEKQKEAKDKGLVFVDNDNIFFILYSTLIILIIGSFD